MTDGSPRSVDGPSSAERELRQRLDILATFNEVIADVNETIVDAAERADIERQVCERLVQTDELRFAWVGVVDETTGDVEPTAWAGDEDGYLDEIDVSVAADRPEGNGPVGRAVRSNAVQATHSIPDDPAFGPFREPALERGYGSAASVPLVYDGVRYGVLTMYAEHERAFTAELDEPISNLGHAVAHGIDTHVRRERERELERREQQLDAVFNSTVQYIGLVEPDGTVLRVNDAALDFSVTPVTDDEGEVSFLVLEGHDITARKERERELRREQERLEFVNRIIRHNLLNGLNVVGARADIVEEFVDDAGLTHLDTIQGRVREMTELVGTMRTFMKVIVERESHEFRPRRIDEAVGHGVESLRRESDAASVAVGRLPEISVVADDLLDEVVEHLLKNAVQHNDKPDPAVEVEVAAGDDAVELRVSDNGPGVPDEEKHRIVDQRIEDLSNPGNGFGLFLVREIVESYGGTVEIEDNDRGGATFVVTLPRA